MTVTVATLGERALRRLGVAIVPVAERPAPSVTIPAATLAERALLELGVTVVPAAERPALSVVIAPVTLATGALVELGVIAADETPSAADAALALSRVSAVHDALVAQAVVSWSLDTVPQAVAEEYIKLTANVMASAFGKTAGDIQIHAALEARVRRVAEVMGALDIAVGAVRTVHDALVAQAVVSWTLDAVPQAVAEEYTKLAANIMASAFGKTAGDIKIHAALEARVRSVALVMGAPDLATQAAMNVHRDLTARGVARWTVFDVPDAAAAAYVLLAANQLAPQFGQQADPRDVVQAMRSLAQYVALPTSGERIHAEFF